ncbi:hypothetical protein L6452_44730 [Arctium lappa]|nr:hypothetical protein L6452_44730 [Arctium lappa]
MDKEDVVAGGSEEGRSDKNGGDNFKGKDVMGEGCSQTKEVSIDTVDNMAEPIVKVGNLDDKGNAKNEGLQVNGGTGGSVPSTTPFMASVVSSFRTYKPRRCEMSQLHQTEVLKVELDVIQSTCDLDPSNPVLREDLAHLLLAYQQARIYE